VPWWVVAALLANCSIVGVEYLNRTQPDLQSALMRTWPLIVLGQVCIFYAWHYAPSLLMAWAVFALGNSLMRVAMVTAVLGEPAKLTWVFLGISLMFAGSYAVKVGTMK